MATSFVDEYLVKLGSSVDQSGMARFAQALKEATSVAGNSASAIAGAFFKAQMEITGGFLAIGTAAVGMVDKVAMADQSYRLLALNMHISKEAARGLQISMDALGATLDQMTWDPELRARTAVLMHDMHAMAPDGDFDAQMKKVRDIRFEFTRMEVEGEFLAMNVVNTFMKALGLGPDTLLEKLQRFNNWVTTSMPEISAKITSVFLPVWKDVKDVFHTVGSAVSETALAFTNLVGIFDHSVSGSTFNFQKFAKALIDVIHLFAVFVEGVATAEERVARLFTAAALASHGRFSEAGSVLSAPVKDGSGATTTNSPILPNIPGFSSGTQAQAQGNAGINIHEMITHVAEQLGIDTDVAHALARGESGERQYDSSGNLLRGKNKDGSHTSAAGVFQLLKGTARGLGVDAADTGQNIKGGLTYLAQLLKMFHGNVYEAVGAYHDGPGAMNKALYRHGALSSEAQAEIAAIARAKGVSGDIHVGSIVIHIDKPGHTNEHVANAVVSKLNSLKNKQTQRNLYELQDAGATG
jgi:hypothetical protein